MRLITVSRPGGRARFAERRRPVTGLSQNQTHTEHKAGEVIVTSKPADAGNSRRGRSNVAGDKTAAQFLDAAERLFARYGYEGTRVRAIADESGVALGALHYYWGTKQALFESVFERRLGPLMRERDRSLEEVALAAEQGPVDVSEIVRAVVQPAMLASFADGESGEVFAGVMARALTDPAPEVREVILKSLGSNTLRYMTLLRRCCPHLDDQAFRWRFLATLGAAQNGYAGRVRFRDVTGTEADELDSATGIAELVAFISAGLMAPAVADGRPPDTAKQDAAEQEEK